jgi:hypothetical protein
VKELSEFDKTLFSLCLSVYNAAGEDAQERHLGEPVSLQKALDEVKEYVLSTWRNR